MDNLEWNRNVDALLYRIQRQDKIALQSLYQLASAKMLGLIVRILNDKPEAEDVLQEVFIKIWQQASQYESTGSAWGWICVMARNTTLDRLRKVQKHPHISTDNDDTSFDEESYEGEHNPDNLALNKCLDALKVEAKKSVLLSYIHGYSHSELAEKMSVPLGTMKAWIRRGLQELKLCLEA